VNGVTLPPDGINFNVNDDDNCGFMKWGLKMFLYLTSPMDPLSLNSKRRFESNEFFDVSVADQFGSRNFVEHEKDFVRTFWEREAQMGFNRLPVIIQRNTGLFFELHETVRSKAGYPQIFNKMNEREDVGKITFNNFKQPVFYNLDGNEIFGAHPIFREGLNAEELVQKYEVGDVEVILDQGGNQFFAAEGQAGGHQVLMAQNGSLVYYTTIVNDAFAYFRTMVGSRLDDSTRFPTTLDEINRVSEFAGRRFGKVPTDPRNLIIELKLSWIDATNLENPERYIITEGWINDYDKSNPKKWIKNGVKKSKLAMVGMHIVASVKGHPEMLWATFEHRQASPNNTYSYINSSGQQDTVWRPYGNWLFCNSTAETEYNIPHMFMVKDSIKAIEPYIIGPSNTLRMKPWGKSAHSRVMNSIMIGVNNLYSEYMPENDPRRNYLIIGNVWTIAGRPPARNTIIGSDELSNSTMETYQQGNEMQGSGTSCFSCHRTNTHKVSHIFESLQPLQRR
jgi:hypothetical protein